MKKTPPQLPRLRNGPRTVTEGLREEYGALHPEDKVLLEAEQTHGNGRGVAPYGYQVTKKKTIKELDEPCRCGNEEAIYVYSSGRATCSPRSVRETCNACGETLREEMHG